MASLFTSARRAESLQGLFTGGYEQPGQASGRNISDAKQIEFHDPCQNWLNITIDDFED